MLALLDTLLQLLQWLFHWQVVGLDRLPHRPAEEV
jgi:hypothetical protein